MTGIYYKGKAYIDKEYSKVCMCCDLHYTSIDKIDKEITWYRCKLIRDGITASCPLKHKAVFKRLSNGL